MAATAEIGEIQFPKEAEAQALRPDAEEPLASPSLLPEPVQGKRKKQKGKKAANLNLGFGPEPVRVLSVDSEAIIVEVLPPSRYAPLRLQVCAQEWGRVWVNGRVLEPRDVVQRVQPGWRARVWQAYRGAHASDDAGPVVLLLLDDEVVLGGRPRRRARVVRWLDDDGALGVAQFFLRDGDLATRELALYRLPDLPPPSQVARPGQLVTLALSLDADALGDSNSKLAALTSAFYAVSLPSAIDDIDDDVEYCNANPPRSDRPLPLLDDGASATLVARDEEAHVMAKRINEAASCSLIEAPENGFLRMELPNEQLHPVLETRCLIENLDSLESVVPKMFDSSFTSTLVQVTDSTNLFLSNFVPSNARDEEKLDQHFCDPVVNVMQPTCKVKTESILKSKNTNVISEISKGDETSEEANGACGESMKNVCDKLELLKSGNLEELLGPFSAKIIKVLPKSAVAEFSLNGLNKKAFFFKSSVVGSESPVLILGADVVLESLEHVEQLHLIKIYDTSLKAGCVKICTEISLKEYPANVGGKDRIIAGESVKSTCDILQKSTKYRQPNSQMSNETFILKNDETCIANMCVSDTNTFTESSEGKVLDFDQQHSFPSNDRFFLELSSNNTLRFNENAVFLDSQIQNGPERDRCHAKTRMRPTSVSGEAEGKSCTLKPLNKLSSKQTENVRSDAQIVEKIVKQSFDEFKPENSEELIGPFSAKVIKVFPKSGIAEFSLNGHNEKAFFLKNSVSGLVLPTVGTDVVLKNLERVKEGITKIYKTTLKAGCVKLHIKTCEHLNGRSGKIKNYVGDTGFVEVALPGKIFLVPFTKEVLKETLSKNKSLKKMWPPGTQVHFHAVLIRQGDKEECNITSVWSHGNESKTEELTQLIKCKQKDGQNGKQVNNPKNVTVKNVEVIIEKVEAHTGVVSKFFSSHHGLIEFYVRNLYLRAEFKTGNCCGILPEKTLDQQWPVSTVVLFNGDLIKNESDIKCRLSKVWLENPCIDGSLLWKLPLEPCVGTVTELRLPQAFIVTVNFLKDGKVLVFSTNYRASISDSRMNKSIPVYLGKKVWVKVRHLSYNAECKYIATTAWPDNKNGSEKPMQSATTLSKRTEVLKTNEKIGTEDILRTTKDSSLDGTFKETKPMLQNGCVSRKTKNILPSQIPTDEKTPLHHQELERLPKLPAERAGPPHRARVTLAVNDAACFEIISYGDTLHIAASADGIALCGVAVAGLDLSLLLTPGQELDIHLLKEDEMKLNENSLCTSAYSKRCLYLPVLWIGSVHFKSPRLQCAALTIFCKKNKVAETVYQQLMQRFGQIIHHDYQSKQENNEEDWNVKSGSPKISQERKSVCNTVSKIKAIKEQESNSFKKENKTLKVESSSFDVESVAEVHQKLERMGPKGFLHAQLWEMTQTVLEDSLSATREYFISSLKQNLIDPSLTETLSSEAHSIMLSAVEEFLQEKGKQAPSNGLPGVSASVPAPGVFVSRAAQSSKASEIGAVAALPRTASVDAKDEQLSLLSPTDPAVVSSKAVEDGCGIPEKENSDDWTDVEDESRDTEGERWTRESVRAAWDCLLDSARDALRGAQAELKATFGPSHLSCAMQGAEIEKSHAQKNIRELAVFRDEACRLIDNWKSAESPPATPEELELLQELSSVLDNVTDGPDKDGDEAYNLARQLLKFWEVANFPLTPLAKRGLRCLQEVLKEPDRRESTVEMEHPSQSGGEEVQEVEAALREVHDAFRDVKHVFEVQRCFRDLRECFRDVRRAYRNREPRPRALPPCADAPTATVLTETVVQTKKRGRTPGDITGSRTPSPAGTPTHSLPKKKQQQHCATCKALVAGEKGEGLLGASDIVTTTTQTSNKSQAEVANLCQSTTMDFSGYVSTNSMDQASQTIATGPVLALQLLPDE